jgi:hypothetical protein
VHVQRTQRFVQLLAIALATLILSSGLAFADNLTADGDGLTPVGNNDMAFGDVCQGVSTTKPFLAVIVRSGSAGSTNVYKDGSTVTIALSSSNAALSFTGGTITLPSDWGAQANGSLSPTGSGSVTITTSTLGAFSASVTIDGNGVNASNAALTRSDNMSVSANVIVCDSTPPDTTIVNKPNNPTNSQSASFTYTSTESGTFQCSLDGAAFATCPNAGISYSSLGAGSHTFQVRAKDAANNVDPTPASYAWVVDIAMPDTSIISAPNAITNQTSASFSYDSTEASSTFQCSLDGAAFSSCPAAGISYSGLASGNHTFEVKATDPAGNTDGTPASHAWTIDLTPPAVSAPDLLAASDTGASDTDDKTKDETPTLTGTAEVASTLELLKGTDVVYTTTIPADGSWSFTSPSLSDGSYTFKARATDTAGNTVTSADLDVLIDGTAPSITSSAKKADLSSYSAGTWTNQSVTVTFACTDGGSGVGSFSEPVTKSTDGADQSTTGTCSDVAGNSAGTTFSDIDIDMTAPGIAFASRTPANGNGWNNGSVTVVWDCTDALSGPASPTVSDTKSSDGADQTASGTCSDNAGNTASANLGGINIDGTDPTITFFSRTPTANGYGWNNGSVTVVWNCADALSGPAALTASDTKSAEGADQTASGTCSDLAGNTASANLGGINIDLTDPTITFASRTAANSNGWNNGDVEVTWNCADDLSGVVSATVSSTTSTEGQNQTTSGTCYDKAGNSKSESLSDVNVDKTDPTITFVSRTPANGNGWNAGPVTVQWSCEDSLSGVEDATVSDTVSSDGPNQTASATCQDKAGNTKSASLSGINIDSVDPTITFVSRTPAANDNGWNNSVVTVVWDCSDALSGVEADTASDTVSSEGTNKTASGTCADLAGNTAGASVAGISVDTTSPSIVLNSRTPANGNGWNKTNVTVVWDCADALSGVESATVSDTKTAEAAGQTASGTCHDKAGNTAGASLGDIRIDKADPGIALNSRTPAANANGWNNSAVTVVWDCTDSLSGVAAAQVSDTKSSDGADQTASGTCADLAGNTKGASLGDINIDSVNPTITLNSRTPANANGWNNTNVTVVWDCADALSGVEAAQASDVKTAEAAGQTASGTCQDEAGNTAGASVGNIKIDKTAPTVAYLSATSSPNVNGWYKSNVTATFRATDNLSGFDASSTLTKDATSTTSGEGLAVTVGSPAFTDQAGNNASAGTATSAAYKIDKTAPAGFVWNGGPDNGASYYFGSVPGAPTCSASDALSGLDACIVTGYSNDVGPHTMTATATDIAGNSASVTRSYTVLAWTLNGFFQPVDMSGVWNTVKNGSTIPLKWRMFAGSTEIKDVAMVKSVTAAIVACSGGTEDVIEEVVTTTGGTVLRYDGTQFIDNWKTPSKPGTCYRATVTAMDGSKTSALFKLK